MDRDFLDELPVLAGPWQVLPRLVSREPKVRAPPKLEEMHRFLQLCFVFLVIIAQAGLATENKTGLCDAEFACEPRT
jgi:hypothetical protein